MGPLFRPAPNERFRISYLYGKMVPSQEKCHEEGFRLCSIKADMRLDVESPLDSLDINKPVVSKRVDSE